jgi:DNA-binding ferritin-like protein (Dps family)
MFDDNDTDDILDRALEVFNRHPARALSAKELSALLGDDISECAEYLDDLLDGGFVYESAGESDGLYPRFRLK